MPFIKLTIPERKRILVLISCILLAIAGWLFMALNNNYVYTAKTVLVYKNFPVNKAFHPLQSDTVDLQVEGTGWQLLFARLRVNPQSIDISLDKLRNKNYILFSEQLYSVNNQLETSQKIISVKPDTLYFDFSERSVKRVPVRLVSNLKFANQYGISGAIGITPAYVTVSGPADDLKAIKEWTTDTLTLENVQNTTVTRLATRHNTLKNINTFPSSVEVKIPVEEFTEKTIEVALKVINNREYQEVKIYPKKVKITFQVPLSSYPMVNESYMDVVVDLDEWKQLGHETLRVKITRFPDFCKLVKVSPSKVDFIIER
jgi:YbbR domain-containing protein